MIISRPAKVSTPTAPVLLVRCPEASRFVVIEVFSYDMG
jgi:hypothetical protein